MGLISVEQRQPGCSVARIMVIWPTFDNFRTSGTRWALFIRCFKGPFLHALHFGHACSPLARRRARGGIAHRHDRLGVGYASATRSVHLSVRRARRPRLAVGGSGSDKTTFLQLLVEASTERVPCVIVDLKGSPALEATVRAH